MTYPDLQKTTHSIPPASSDQTQQLDDMTPSPSDVTRLTKAPSASSRQDKMMILFEAMKEKIAELTAAKEKAAARIVELHRSQLLETIEGEPEAENADTIDGMSPILCMRTSLRLMRLDTFTALNKILSRLRTESVKSTKNLERALAAESKAERLEEKVVQLQRKIRTLEDREASEGMLIDTMMADIDKGPGVLELEL